jgi:tRNA modification GTPase
MGANVDSAPEILVLNKSDLTVHPDWSAAGGVRISCLTGTGVSHLEQEIVARITAGNLHPENNIAINARHRECLRRALESGKHAIQLMREGISSEYVAVDLNGALQALGEIIGTVDVENVLDSVFGQFCIGK